MTLDHDAIEIYVYEMTDAQIVFLAEMLARNIASGDWEELDRLIDVITEERKKRCI